MGKLGGLELNYSSDIDLIFLCENDGQTDGPRPISNLEFFDLVAREVVRLLTEKTELGGVYRVDMRLRPEGQRGPMVMGVQSCAGATTTTAAAPGSGRPTSRPGPWPATFRWATSSSKR